MTGTPPGLPRLYTAAEVAAALRCSKWWVQEQVRNGRFPCCEVAGSYCFSAEHYAVILRLLEKQRVEPADSMPPTGPLRRTTPEPASGPAARLVARVPRRVRAAGIGEAA